MPLHDSISLLADFNVLLGCLLRFFLKGLLSTRMNVPVRRRAPKCRHGDAAYWYDGDHVHTP